MATMHIALIRQDDGSYNLTVDGILYLEGESFAIADRVADALRDPRFSYGEIGEVAESIRIAHAVE